MPSASAILAGLTAISSRAVALAVAWHVVLAVAIAALALGWRPARRTAGALLAIPLASVAALAFGFGNPFNGALFAAGTAALLALAAAGDRTAAARGPSWTWWTGAAMIAFGWVYPHFSAGLPLGYLYAAPVGLIPCPTLSVAIGFALLAGGLGTRPWRLALAGLGLFYGLFGVLRLGVLLDVGLVGGAALLAATVLHAAKRAARAGDGTGAPGHRIAA